MKRSLEYLLARILSFLNRIVPKKKNLIVFYDSLNEELSDNTEAIYRYIIQHDIEKKYIKKILLANGKNKNSKIVCAIQYMRAKYVFYSFGDLRIKPSRKQIVVNQWHGSPLKTVGKLSKDESIKKERTDNFTFLLASSELFKKPLAKAFGCEEDKVKIAGQARNDYLFEEGKSLYYLNALKGDEYEKTILWMPTFRISNDGRFKDSTKINTETLLPIFGTFKELEKLNSYLREKNVLLVIKIHHYAMFEKKNYSNIKYVTNDDLEKYQTVLYSFVKDFDSLVTDYSSIFADYCLLNKPMGFTLDDYEEYKKERGFSIDDPMQYMAGHHIMNINDFYDYTCDLRNNSDKYEKKRKRVMKIMNEYASDNCKRLCILTGISFNQKKGK